MEREVRGGRREESKGCNEGRSTARRGLLGESRGRMRRRELIKDGATEWDGNRSGLLWSAAALNVGGAGKVWSRKSAGNDEARDTVGSVDGVLDSMFYGLHGGYIWVRKLIKPLAGNWQPDGDVKPQERGPVMVQVSSW